jgi:hypothetical protein
LRWNQRKVGLVTNKTRGLCRADTSVVEDSWVMLAKKISIADSELPTQPLNACPTPRVEPPAPTHLMLVKAPRPSPRSLAWARRRGAPSLDAVKLELMLRLERLNLG